MKMALKQEVCDYNTNSETVWGGILPKSSPNTASKLSFVCSN